ncbi:TlpA family protein disulfide reductase [Cohnella thermotolerans]|jgi:cytochrome c biogenesis protein CcmG/thiol:disulfide interchange protein DsbE|uniref:TlpA family protein disulfide reductase n=1 Tax=Cohnella thermotolerans TaxID=329858 RepID=UPI0004025A89|nr:TlpA disulfide reductase family protein [Cohnella thermotolerans]
MRRNIVILGAVLIALAAIVAFNWPGQDRKGEEVKASAGSSQAMETAPKQGALAPSFELASIDGATNYKVGGKRDKALIINFWASWCGPCDMEAPDLIKLYDKYKDRLDLYAVNETKYDTVRGAKDFVKEKELTFPVLMDKTGKVGDDYKVYSYPISFIVDRDGVVRHRIEGVQPIADWENMLKDVL